MQTMSSDSERVVITGLGVISSIGTGTEAFARALRAGASGDRAISMFDTTGYDYANGCEVVDFAPKEHLSAPELDTLGRATQFSVAAAVMAIKDSGFPIDQLRSRRGVISIGTTDGESQDLDRLAETWEVAGPSQMNPTAAKRVPAGRLSIAIAEHLGLDDVEAVTLPTACAAGNYAIGYGLDAIRTGEAEYALCGGADAMCRKTFTGFYRLGTIAPEKCQPFDVNRKGILTGEGAGVLLIESLKSARSRGARIHAEVLGYGLTCDAYHQVAPKASSVSHCIELALEDASIRPSEVDLISAHGTGTRANDVTECAAIRDIFGSEPPRVVSVKSMIGHTMGAASALGAIACSLAIEGGFIPPTINHVSTDPDCDVDCVPNQAITADLQIVQNNGLAFGGNNAVVMLGKCAR